MERKSLTITEVEAIKKVGDKQIPKLTFKAKDGDKELVYFTFKSSLFDLIKTGQKIDADVETATREYDGKTYTDRRVVQVYVDGQPISTKNPYRGKSPEELEQQARLMILAYAKDLVVADKVTLPDMLREADRFYTWLRVADILKPVPLPQPETKIGPKPKDEIDFDKPLPKPEGKIQNVTEFKGLLSKHKVGTREAYEILSINSFMDMVDLDAEWAKIKEAKKIG